MSNTTTSTQEDAKKECLEIIKSCSSKAEVETNFPEVAKTIKENKWHYMYGDKYLGADLKDTPPANTPPPAPIVEDKSAEAPNASKDLDLQAKNLKQSPPPPQSPKISEPPKKKKHIAKTYKLTRYQPLSFTLNVGRANNLTVYDDNSEATRAIRHCPNTKTIWLDEQNNDIAVVEPIVFIKGFFHTTERMGYTQDFLDQHPKNGQVFEEVDKEKDASVEINLEDKKIDIKSAIRDRMKDEGGIEEVRAIVAVLDSNVVGAAKMSPPELRYAAYMCVDSNPTRFLSDAGEINIFDDVTIKRTALAQHAFISGLIQVSPNGRQVVWSNSRKPICAVPQGLNYLSVFANFLASEEGIIVAQELTA